MEFTRQVIQTNPNPTYVKNEQGMFILANEAYASLHGLTVDELLAKGSGVFDYSFERDLELLKSNETSTIEEFYKLKVGEKKWFKTIKKPFEQADGTRFLLSVSSDITLLKSAVQAAEDAARAKENFLASISSEIRTPISAIKGIARLLRKSLLNKDQEGYLDTIASIADNLLEIPNDLLDILKLESGEVKLVNVPFDVSSVISDAVRAMAYKTQEQEVSIRYIEPNEEIPVVEGDPFRLSQVLFNLMNNALKYTRQGEITVEVHRIEKVDDVLNIECCVKDTGAGFSAEKFEKISEALKHENRSISQLYGGTGLGLTISKKLLELQGGRLWLENSISQGNCFYFHVPYALSDRKNPLKKVELNLKPHQLSGLTILVAEDNQLNELLLISQLHSWGISTDVAYDGEQALEKANKKKYDLILMDIQMPKMDGIEATYQIRNKQNLNKNTPIIAFTANLKKIDIDRYKFYGFTDCLRKPYHESKLLHFISLYTGRSATQESGVQHEPPQSQPALFDFSGLGNLKDDALFIRKMQQMFIDTVPMQLDELEEAIERNELDTAAHMAHKLKSTFGNIKITPATEAMKKIEAYANSKTKLEELGHLMQIVREVTNKVVKVFVDQLQTQN